MRLPIISKKFTRVNLLRNFLIFVRFLKIIEKTINVLMYFNHSESNQESFIFQFSKKIVRDTRCNKLNMRCLVKSRVASTAHTDTFTHLSASGAKHYNLKISACMTVDFLLPFCASRNRRCANDYRLDELI